MKKILCTLIIAASFSSYAQTNTYPWPQTGNIGIGTASPAAALDIVRAGTNAGVDYPSARITTSGTGNIYGPILYLNGASGAGGKMWGLVSSGALDAAVTGAAGNFAIYDAAAGSRMVINSSGFVGIGTTNPLGKLHVTAGNIVLDTICWYSSRNSAGVVSPIMGVRQNTVYVGDLFGNLSGANLVFRANGTNQMVVSNDGNISIGTDHAQGYKLAVNGTAIATSMTVKLNANWPDYVFKASYLLPSLEEVKNYVNENHHLPDIPSAEEIAEKGQNLGEVNKLLLKKIEELTLYMIDLNKDNAALKLAQDDMNKRLKRHHIN